MIEISIPCITGESNIEQMNGCNAVPPRLDGLTLGEFEKRKISNQELLLGPMKCYGSWIPTL